MVLFVPFLGKLWRKGHRRGAPAQMSVFRQPGILGYDPAMTGDGAAQDEGVADGAVCELLCGVFDCSPDLGAKTILGYSGIFKVSCIS